VSADERHVTTWGEIDPDLALGAKGRGGLRANTQTIVSESGLYKLILRSDKPEAKQFRLWVTRDMLPAIRKDGGYILGDAHRAPENDSGDARSLPMG
jgi:prophage antirepressor-like protein